MPLDPSAFSNFNQPTTPLLNPLDIQAKKLALRNALAAGQLNDQAIQGGALDLQAKQLAMQQAAQYRARFNALSPGGAPAPAAAAPQDLATDPQFGGAPLPAAPPPPAGAPAAAPAGPPPTAAHEISDDELQGIFGPDALPLIKARNEANKTFQEGRKLRDEANANEVNYFGSVARGLKAVNFDPGAVQAALKMAQAHGYGNSPQFQLFAQNANNPAALPGLAEQAMEQSDTQRKLSTEQQNADAATATAAERTQTSNREQAKQTEANLRSALGAATSQSDWNNILGQSDPALVKKLNIPAAFSPAAKTAVVQAGLNPQEQVTTAEAKRRDDQTAANENARLVIERNNSQRLQKEFELRTNGALGQLNPRQQSLANDLGHGNVPISVLSRLPAAEKEAILAGATEINPQWPQAYETKESFTNPEKVQAKNLGTISRIVGHIGRFETNSKELGTSPLYGMAGVNLTGLAKATAEDGHALSAELEKLLAGAAGSEGQMKQWQSDLRSTFPGVRQKAVDEISQLIGSQYEGMAQTYKAGTKEDLPITKYLTPGAQNWMKSKGIDVQTSAPAGAPAAAGSVSVTDPAGGVHVFPNASAAETFKKSAGIK